DARRRVEEGISPICLAVLYPKELRQVTSLPDLRKALGRAQLTVRVVSEGSDGDWAETSLDGLADILRRSYELLVSEDVVVTAVAELGGAIDSATETFAAGPATPQRLRALLGIPAETDGTGSQAGDEDDLDAADGS